MKRYSLAVVLLAAWGCGPSDMDPIVAVYGSEDGTTYPLATPLQVTGDGVLLSESEITLVTWPEFERIPSAAVTITLRPGCERDVGPNCSSVASIAWSDAEVGRWYAVRFSPSTTRGVVIDEIYAIPLSDGTYIWRVYRGSAPQVDRIVLDRSESAVRVFLSEEVRLRAGHTLDTAFSAAQGGATCVPFLPGERFTAFEAICSPALDPFAPTTVRISDAWESLVGAALPSLDLVIDLDEGSASVVLFDPLLPPPLVPASLCAGWACVE